jgi:AbrB family looped-hinge helix DNA binding protein
VIPKDVRRRHQLSAGSRLTLIEDGDRLVLVPEQQQTVAVEQGGLLIFRGELPRDFPDHRQLREERFTRVGGSG